MKPSFYTWLNDVLHNNEKIKFEETVHYSFSIFSIVFHILFSSQTMSDLETRAMDIKDLNLNHHPGEAVNKIRDSYDVKR